METFLVFIWLVGWLIITIATAIFGPDDEDYIYPLCLGWVWPAGALLIVVASPFALIRWAVKKYIWKEI